MGAGPQIHDTQKRLRRPRADAVDVAGGSLLDVPDDVTDRPVVTYGPTSITPLDHPLFNNSDVTLAEIAEQAREDGLLG